METTTINPTQAAWNISMAELQAEIAAGLYEPQEEDREHRAVCTCMNWPCEEGH